MAGGWDLTDVSDCGCLQVRQMNERDGYVVRVKTGPAYVLGVLLAVELVFFGAGLLWAFVNLSAGQAWIFLVLVACCVAIGLTTAAWMLRRFIARIRHPPQLSPTGLRVWLHPTSTYLLMPWPEISELRIADLGVRRGLFVYVRDPQALADRDPSDARRIRRELRRFRGALFAYPVVTRGGRLTEIDRAIRHFSDGRLTLT
jgi:hypothetical protein